MALISLKCFKCFIILLVLVFQTECRRSGSGGHRTSSGGSRHTGGSHNSGGSHHTSSGGGFQHSTGGGSHHSGFGATSHGSNGLPSTHSVSVGTGFLNPHSTGSSNAFHQTNTHQVGSGKPVNPSAPVLPSNTRPDIGFENINRNQAVGSQNSRNDIGFENVHSRLPSQTGHPMQPVTSNIHHPIGGGVQPHHNGNIQRPAVPGPYPYPGNTATNHPYPVQSGGSHTPQYGTYHPYQPQTMVFPGGGVQYHPPVQQQYIPPVTTVHVPMYQPMPVYQSSPVYQKSSGGSLLSHGGSFLGGYLIGRASGGIGFGGYNNYHHHPHYDNYNNYNGRNDYYNERDSPQNNYYTVHNYYHNREDIPRKFSVPDDSTIQCATNTSQSLCVPNTDAICLKNGTIMCVTNMPFTKPCGPDTKMACVYTRINCTGNPECNNQTFVDFYLPCLSNVTLVNNRIFDSSSYQTHSSYELCVTAIANPKKLESPVGALALFTSEIGKWHLNHLSEIHNNSI